MAAPPRPPSDDFPGPVAWPEPPGCPECRAPIQAGAGSCWLCGADLPTAPEPPTTAPPPGPEEGAEPGTPRPGRRAWPRPRPRVSIATSMIGIGVLGVLLAVGSGRAGIVAGLVVVVGPSAGYLVARALRVEGGGDRPSTAERVLGEVAVTVLVVTVAASALALAAALAAGMLRALPAPP